MSVMIVFHTPQYMTQSPILFLAQQDIAIIKAAMLDWTKHTCLQFTEKTPNDNTYIYIQDGEG